MNSSGEQLTLSAESLAFLSTFQKRHQRPLRVCHIGNIASNAYHNAKLMALAGIESDVLALHDYFVMSTPEWEEADIDAAPGNLFQPDWYNLDLRGYTRPRWYVQGDVRTCLRYVIARRQGNQAEADRLWQELGLSNQTLPPPASTSALVPDAPQSHTVCGLRRKRRRFLLLHVADRLREVCCRMLLHTASCLKRTLRRIKANVLAVPLKILKLVKWGKLRITYGRLFPHRMDALKPDDIAWAIGDLDLWDEALRHYDMVIGYSIYPLFPLLCDVPYLALEHGTLRDLPFVKDGQGRMLSLSYARADHVFVTNFDCLPKAELLAPGNYTFLNHPYHQDHALPISGAKTRRAQLQHKLDADFLIFFPARQDWVKGMGYADKGNDVFIRAFARLRQSGRRVGLVLCEWGRNIAESKQLLSDLGVAQYVLWMSPVGAVGFNRHCQACDLVADQFTLGAFGGVLFKAFCNATPVITYLDEAQLRPVYPELPPVINARTEDDIVARISEAMSEPKNLVQLGKQGRAWVERCHNGLETLDRQLRVFAQILGYPAPPG